MRPAFASTREAAAFAALVLILLAAPWIEARTFLPGRERAYSSESIRWEKFPWVQKFIFEETNDIDIAFVGSSHITDGINTPYVQEKLREKTGGKGEVRSIAWFWPGFDALYFFTRDLLSHRHVNTIVFNDECAGSRWDVAHHAAPLWFRLPEDGGDLGGLPFKYRAIYYYAAVIGAPRNFLEWLVPNLPPEPHDQLTGNLAYKISANPEIQLGCISSRVSLRNGPLNPSGGFVPYQPHTGCRPEDLEVLNAATATNFFFTDRPLPDSQVYFARKFAALARAHGCRLIELHMPLTAAKSAPVIRESRNWPDFLRTDIRVIGIPERKLFAGLSDSQMDQLFCEADHFNLNGQEYFTRLITPGLLNLYESQFKR